MAAATGWTWLGRGLWTGAVVIEHLQVMSFGNMMINDTPGWTSGGTNLFSGLENIALRFSGTAFMVVYVISLVLSFLGLILYLLLNEKIHSWNKGEGVFFRGCIWLFEYIIYGIGFVPMAAAFVDVQYCDENGNLADHPTTTCWVQDQMVLLVFGFLGLSVATMMAGVVFPVLKHERKGLEQRRPDGDYFPGLFQLIEVGIITLFAGMHRPYIGILFHGLLVVYLFLFPAYQDWHVNSGKMAVLWGQLWVFICATVARTNSTGGTEMLVGWVPVALVGYFLMLGNVFVRKQLNSKVR